jgi:hypothetical protein
MPLNLRSCFGSRTLVSCFSSALQDLADGADIERTYGGGKKPLASRVPLSWVPGSTPSEAISAEDKIGPLPQANIESAEATPGATEGMLVNDRLVLHEKLISKARQRPSQSFQNYPTTRMESPRRSVRIAAIQPCLSSLLPLWRMWACLLDERGQRQCRCTI